MPTGSEVTAIVGGGAAGALTALHLRRTTSPAHRLLVVEPGSELGKGVAYGTTDEEHLLNVRAGRLGAFGDAPGDFAAWAAQRGVLDPTSFLPRAWYGEYLNSLLSAVEHVRARAVDVLRTGAGVRVLLDDGNTIDADRAVLAPGPTPPAWPRCLGGSQRRDTDRRGAGRRWVHDPWERGAFDSLRPGDPVLLVGTGLTAVDVAISLGAAGHPIVAVSRHGLLPGTHPEQPSEPIRCDPPAASTARSLVAWARAAASESGDWLAVVDAIRGVADEIWGRMTEPEQLRLLHHVHRRWEVLRHRMAPPVAERIRSMQESRQLEVTAGRMTRSTASGRGVEVTVGETVFRVAAVVNCTGPCPDVTKTSDALVRRLLERGTARPGPLNLGIDTDPRGSLPGTDDTIWLVGPLRRGRKWETTAIPEIREQAATLAASVGHVRQLLSA